MQLQEFTPRPSLVTQITPIERARFPLIDAHDHLGEYFGNWTERPLSELIDLLDQAGVEVFVDLDGGWGEGLFHSHLVYFKQPAPQRFKIFTGVDWNAWPEKGDRFGEWAAQKLREHALQGADGLKVWKDFGLHVRDQHGLRVKVEDPRLEPIWSTAGELGLPVTWHVADPVAFFDPLDAHNERWEELQAHPDWHFPSPPFPGFLSLVNGMAEVISRHLKTTFIGAHVGCYAENLAWVAALLERCPNFFIDISARTAELGRQPYTTRRFFMKYADRILYGTDAGPNLQAYRLLARFLETDDEYFNYDTSDRPPQGRWQVYGLYLPDDVLEKVYYLNAARILNGR